MRLGGDWTHGHVGTRQGGNLVIKNVNAFAGSPPFSSTSSTRFGRAGDRLGDFKGVYCTDIPYEFIYIKFTISVVGLYCTVAQILKLVNNINQF